MQHLRTDQYTRIERDCPMHTDLHPADDVVEIIVGDHRFGDNTLRLLADTPNTCLRLIAALNEAHDKLTQHLHVKANPDPAMSQLNQTLTAPVVG